MRLQVRLTPKLETQTNHEEVAPIAWFMATLRYLWHRSCSSLCEHDLRNWELWRQSMSAGNCGNGGNGGNKCDTTDFCWSRWDAINLWPWLTFSCQPKHLVIFSSTFPTAYVSQLFHSGTLSDSKSCFPECKSVLFEAESQQRFPIA